MEVLNVTLKCPPDFLDGNVGNLSGNDTVAQPPVPCADSVFFFIIYGPVWGLVCLFGLIGNSLSFAVLHRSSKHNVASFLLKTLGIADNLFLLAALAIQMYPAMVMSFGLTEHLIPIYPYLQTYAWPLSHISQMGTVWMTVLVAANRYVAVCHPLQAPRLCSKHKVKLQMIYLSVLIVFYNIPRFFEYHYVWTNVTTVDNATGDMLTELHEVNMGLTSHKLYNILYENVSYMLFLFLLPLMILIVLNVHLVRELKAAQKCREILTSRSKNEENNITLVMIVIIIVFIVCQTPAAINQVLFYIVDDVEKSQCSHYNKYYHISNLLLIMNSSVNFVIYCLFRRQFQQDVCALICGKERPPGSRGSSMRVTTSVSYRNSMGRSTCTTQESLPLTPTLSDGKSVTIGNNSHNGYRKWCT